MSTLINRIQRAFLGSAGDEKVRALLADLQIPAGGSGGTIREARRGFLRPISDESVLRDALANLGLTGGGGGGTQSLSSIRNAILHNRRDSESTVREGLNDLLMPDDLSGGAGGPNWVPADAKVHIDLINNRAWTEADGEVTIDTLLGSDPNTNNWYGTSEYDAGNLTVNGYVSTTTVALIGVARTLATGNFTGVFEFEAEIANNFLIGTSSADGNYAIEFYRDSLAVGGKAYQGSYEQSIADIVNDPGTNAIAVTLTATRAEFSANGSAANAVVITATERPASLVTFVIDADDTRVQSITLYDPLPDTTGLSELSEAG